MSARLCLFIIGAVCQTALLAVINTANAATIHLRAWLNGQQEVPAVATGATGTATLTYDTGTGQLSWHVAYGGLSSPINGAHFHGPTPAGFDANITVGMTAGPSPIVGSATISASQAAQLLSGQWYINLHSDNFGGGEIRGQVVVVRGDLNGDGQSDVVWRNISTGENYLWPMNGTAILPGEGYLRQVADQNWQMAGMGDFDGDGKADILWRNSSTGENYLYFMNGTSIAAEGYLRTVADQDWQVVGVGDFNADGRADVLWRNLSTGENYLYLMNGTSIAGEGYLRTVVDQNWRVVGVGDFNGDGRGDVLWRNSSTGENYIYLMNGTSIAGEGYLRTVADQSWRVVGVGDFDGDGRSDILWRHGTGENYLYPMAGLTIMPSEGYIRTVADPNWMVAALGDYDGDGKSDILWRNAATGETYLYPMDGRAIEPAEGSVRTVADLSWRIPPTVRRGGLEICNNGVDDDGDGVVDLADPDCGGFCQDCSFDHCPPGFICGFDGCCVSHCNDGERNGTEGDVDCGGDCQAKCETGQTCGLNADCASGVCSFGRCQ